MSRLPRFANVYVRDVDGFMVNADYTRKDIADDLLAALEGALEQMVADLIAMDAELGPSRDDVDEIIADDPQSAAVCAIVAARAAIAKAKGE